MAMISTLRIGLAAAFLAAGSVALGDDSPTPPRWKFHAGDTIRYVFHQDNIVITKVNGKEIPNNSQLTLDLTWKVKSVAANGTAEIEQTVERARSKIETADQKIAFDSNDANVPTDTITKSLYDVYKPAVKSLYTLKVNARGKILEAHVPPKVTQALLVSPFKPLADGGSVFSDVGVKNLLSQVLPLLPEKVTEKGQTWSETLEVPCPPLKMTLTTRYRLASSTADATKFEAALDIAVTPDSDAPFTLEVKKGSKGTGTFTLDTKSGQVSEAHVRHNLEFLIKAGDREVPQTSVIDVTLTRQP